MGQADSQVDLLPSLTAFPWEKTQDRAGMRDDARSDQRRQGGGRAQARLQQAVQLPVRLLAASLCMILHCCIINS